MSITFRHMNDLHSIRNQNGKGMGLLYTHFKEKQSKRLNRSQSFQILKRKEWIGFMSISLSENHIFVDAMELDERAQEQGMGRKVLRKLELEAKRRKKQSIYLYVLKQDQSNLSMFQRCGFTITDQGRKYWVMEKELMPTNDLDNKFLCIHFPL